MLSGVDNSPGIRVPADAACGLLEQGAAVQVGHGLGHGGQERGRVDLMVEAQAATQALQFPL
jgi:hypothetical protein